MDITIVGAGKLGAGLARSLSNEDYNVTIVDLDQQRVNKLVEKYDIQGICGSGTHLGVLREANVGHSDLVIAATLSDENNILVCLIAKKLGAKNTIARVRNPEYNDQFDFMRGELGISMMVNPDYSAALEISRLLQFPYVVDIESFANGYIDMAEFKISESSKLCDCRIVDIPSRFRTKMLICAVERKDEVFIPNGDFIIHAGDKIHVTGAHSEFENIEKLVASTKKHHIKNTMIIGGSRVGVYLADILVSMNKNVIIIESDRDKCKQIFDMVPDATIVNGDANDHDILDENGISRMDAVITLTNMDEINFLVSLYAKKIGVPKTVSKINNSNFRKMLEDLDLDSKINVSEISVDTITQYVRAKQNVSSSYMRTLYKLVDGKVEAAEFLASDKVSFLGKPLSKIKLKKGILISSINRNNEIIFPNGNDFIQENDLVIVVSKEKRISSLNDIIQ